MYRLIYKEGYGGQTVAKNKDPSGPVLQWLSFLNCETVGPFSWGATISVTFPRISME